MDGLTDSVSIARTTKLRQAAFVVEHTWNNGSKNDEEHKPHMMKVFTILPWLLLSGGIHAFVPSGTSSTGIVAKSRNTEWRMMNGANLMNYALEKVIDTSVPTLGAIAVVLVAAKVIHLFCSLDLNF